MSDERSKPATSNGPSSALQKSAPLEEDTVVEQVKVVVRCRPPSVDETSGEQFCTVDARQKEVSLIDGQRYGGLQTSKVFTFDAVYDVGTNQEEVKAPPFLLMYRNIGRQA